jgi:hypothetical protein
MEQQVVKINGLFFDANTVTDLGIAIMNDLKRVDEEFANLNFRAGIAKLAKDKLMDELVKESSKFTEVEAPAGESEPEPEPEPAAPKQPAE